MAETTTDGSADPSRANLLFFLMTRGAGAFAAQMLDVAIGWHVYTQTHSAMSLGWIGLAQFVPLLLLLRWSGHFADIYDRRRVSAFAALGQGAASLAIFAIAATSAPVWLNYAALFGLGSARAFAGPANSSLLPEIVSKAAFSRAVAMSTTMFQAATIAGPAMGGLLFALIGVKVFLVCGVAASAAAALVMAIRLPARDSVETQAPPAESAALAGLGYVWSNKVVLGAVSLDLFAVLLGGVSALLPIYAHDILNVGPAGLGVLRAGPAVGAIVVGLLLAVWPLKRGVGTKMFVCVAGYGVATIVFALSKSFALSLGAMAALGAFDVVSMVVRQTLVQLATPSDMRGRVAAVSFLFIGASNQLGEFESGFAAALLGPVGAALLGGVGTLVVAALWAGLFPHLRKADHIGA